MFNYTKKSMILKFTEQSKKEYLEYLEYLKKFVKDDQWFNMLSIDGIVNKDLNQYIERVINKINSCEFNSNNLEKIMLEIRNSISKLVNEYETKNLSVDEKYYISRYIYSLYGLIEVITEGSIVSEKILDMFKEKYKDNYLKVLKKIDNLNPSELTNIKSKDETNVDIDFESEEIKLYLLMKKWQDDQHVFHDNLIIGRHNHAKELFEKYAKEKYPYLSSLNGLPLFCTYILNEAPILEIEQVEKFLNTWFSKKLACVIGGKNLGLAILSNNGVKIPLTYVVPVNSSFTQSYINELQDIPNVKYAIRSSATVEDNENQSFAGLFTSILDVDKCNFKDAGKKVYDSAFTERVNSYVEHFKTDKPYMSIVIQQFREPIYSGVWLGDSENSGHLEWTNGNGEKLVSGKVKPKHEYWDISTNNVNNLNVNDEFVGKICINLQNKLNTIADFEFCIVNGELFFVQFRPVTKKISKISNIKTVKNDDVSGVAASQGFVAGHPVYLEDVEEAENFKKGDILLTDYTDPKWVPIMMKASAIVTAEGGFLSHTAIISRELAIPCVTGVGYSNIEKLSKCDTILVDGTNGIVSKK